MGATFSECPYGQGGHVHPELIIVEIVGEDGMPVPDGEVGEIVVTTLGVEAMPLLRFRTGIWQRKSRRLAVADAIPSVSRRLLVASTI